jgi:hypothetical protein
MQKLKVSTKNSTTLTGTLTTNLGNQRKGEGLRQSSTIITVQRQMAEKNYYSNQTHNEELHHQSRSRLSKHQGERQPFGPRQQQR